MGKNKITVWWGFSLQKQPLRLIYAFGELREKAVSLIRELGIFGQSGNS